MTFQEKEILDIENIVTEMKNFLNGFMNGLDMAKGRMISFTQLLQKHPKLKHRIYNVEEYLAKHICGCLCAQILKRVAEAQKLQSTLDNIVRT